MKYILFLIGIILFSCKNDVQKRSISLLDDKSNPKKLVQETEETIKTRFSLPNGFIRVTTKSNTFENYLQNFKLKPHNSKVHLYNGELKSRQDVHAAILDIDVGKKDLQQCADATIRLRAEFLYKQKRYDDISFNFTNGFQVAYSKWRKGNRIKVKGNKVFWYKTDKNSTTYHSFKQYMQLVFIYAGTLSLDKEMNHIDLNDMQIGDVFIQGGSPGHAIIIVDMAKNDKNETIFMLAQSYMPAQEIHILKNFNDSAISPWYKTKTILDNSVLQSPEWNFDKNNLKRFP